jgi:putative polyketide hydroxylase
VLITGAKGQAWCAAARNTSAVPIECLVRGHDFDDSRGEFTAAYRITDTGAVLVRPDGFISWRARSWSNKTMARLSRKCHRAITAAKPSA